MNTVVILGQGELRGKVHLSHRCIALEAWNGSRLRRREDRPIGLTRMFHELLWRDHEHGRAIP